MYPPELFLDGIAQALRTEIGPAIDDAYVRTQAFMAAVIIERLSHQVRVDRGADVADLRAAFEDVAALVDAADGAAAVVSAVAAGRTEPTRAALSELARACYAEQRQLGDRFEPIRDRLRLAMRSLLDRELAYATEQS